MKIIKGYIYKITIVNKESKLNGKTYIGKHCTSNPPRSKKEALVDGYWGSGTILKEYYQVWGVGYKCKKEILEFIYFWEDTSKLEQKHIVEDSKKKGFFFKKQTNINLINAKK